MSDDETSRNGHGPRDVALPRLDRTDAPAYVRAYLERRARKSVADEADEADAAADDLPLYLRRYRRRDPQALGPALAPPIDGEPAPTWTEAWAQTSKSPETVLPPEMHPPSGSAEAVVDVHLIRHGETQGYSVNAGLTPMGRWQAHRRGHDLSKGVRDGEPIRIVCAPTPRASESGEQLRRGIEQGLEMWARTAPVSGPEAMDEFRNFGVWTPSGEKDVTSAFREYHALAERHERTAIGERPLWLVELDRFVRIQRGGGDPIAYWMTMPLVSFEPASAVVLRFWAGIIRLVADAQPGTRVLIATHSGPIRALATWALGHDAGEPYNVEEVRVKVRRSLASAQVTYRNRTAEIHVPPASEWPSWTRRADLATIG
jgi:broad specificity phosphatase PhoE